MTSDLIERLRAKVSWRSDEDLMDEAADHIASLEAALAEASPKADEISPYEWLAQEFDRLAILRKMWTAYEVAAMIRRHDIERPAARALDRGEGR
jgi:hypothetical protein